MRLVILLLLSLLAAAPSASAAAPGSVYLEDLTWTELAAADK